MQYYKERFDLLNDSISIGEDKLKEYWLEIYNFFSGKGYFKLAENGVGQGKHTIALKFQPSPEQFFLLHLGKIGMWPIEPNIGKYSIEDIFTVIEMYYAAIADCTWGEDENGENNWIVEREKPKSEYATFLNNILRFYEDGYYLEPNHGYIMPSPNKALLHQLQDEYSELPSDIYDRLKSATKDFYRFDATLERQRKAIASLADILESVRDDLKNVLNNEYNIAKNDHDKLIFEVVNNYNIRHDNDRQKKDYSKEIWLDWMMQYYTSTIIAYYRLKEKISVQDSNK